MLSGVAWSFRFSNSQKLKNKMIPVIIGPHPHLEIKDWLKRLELEEYEGKR